MKYSLNKVKSAKGDLQGFFNRLILEPIFDRSTWFIANFTNLTANHLSFIGFIFGVASAISFFTQHFIFGAVFFEIMNLFDTFDGRIARLKNISSKFGTYVDWYLGFYMTFIISFGLLWGLYAKFGDLNIWPYGILLYFLLIIRFVEGNVVGFITGGAENYKKTVNTGETNSLLSKIRRFFIKLGLREPFNMTDNQHVIFFIMPITGWYYGLYWVMVIGITLHVLVWFFNYRALLKNIT
jgi:phosphatidylglycerophosphate synthase